MQWELIKCRKIKGLNQQEMADYLDINVETYGKKERGQQSFNQDEMFAVAELFKLKLHDIFLPRNFGNTEIKEGNNESSFNQTS